MKNCKPKIEVREDLTGFPSNLTVGGKVYLDLPVDFNFSFSINIGFNNVLSLVENSTLLFSATPSSTLVDDGLVGLFNPSTVILSGEIP